MTSTTLPLFGEGVTAPRPVPRDEQQKHERKRGVAQVLYDVLAEGERGVSPFVGEYRGKVWWTLPELERELSHRGRRVLATSISARLRDLRKAPFNATVQRRTRVGSAHLEEYALGAAVRI